MSRNRNWPRTGRGRCTNRRRILLAGWAILLPAIAGAQTYTISLIAGTASTSGFSGDSGQATSAVLNSPTNVTVDSNHNIYIVDKGNGRIRKVSTSGVITTVAGSTANGTYAGDGGPAISASLDTPNGVAFDSSGNMYIADTGNNVVRKVNTSGTISTVAGNTYSAYAGDGGPATSASLSSPTSVAVDSAGNLYIADANNNCIREVTTDQNIHTVAGQCSYALYQGDGGPALQAKLNKPYSIALDAYGDLFISDTENEVIREVTPDGIIHLVAGTPGTTGFQEGPALQAKFNSPSGISMDASGSIYIADKSNFRIRKLLPSGNVVTVAGTGSPGYSGDNGPATSAKLYFAPGVGTDSSGNVFIADLQNQVVRQLTISNASSLPSVSKGGVVSAAQFGALASPAPGSWIEIYGSNLAANAVTWTASDFNGNTAPTWLGSSVTTGTSVTIGGQSAYVDYVSSGQVNVEIPSTAPTGTQPIVVTSGSNVSPVPPQTINISATAPGLFAPQQLLIGGNQYLGAQFSDFSTWVLPPNAVSGFTSQRAKPGDTIILYGIGFGAVVTNLPAGQIAQGTSNTLSTGAFQIFFGGTQATVNYAGLTPESVGLYQFNVVVPNVPANDLTPVTFTLNGVAGKQTLYTAIGN